MGELWMRILRLQREMMELKIIISALQARITAIEQQSGALVPVTRPWVLREPVAESGVEREVLRLERELARLWFDVRNMVNFRMPPLDQGLASLGDTLLGSGGPSFPPDPTGFGCDGFMPTTLIWHDPYFGDQSMTYNPNTGQYESDPDTFDYDSCCGCDAASNVPVQWTYSTTGVTMKYKGDGGGCPTSGSPGDNLNQNVPFNNNGISFCTTDPGEFGTNPMDPVNDDSGPGCIIYSCTPDPFGTLDTPVSGVSPCTYIPRTLYFKESQFGVWTLRYDGDEGGWFGEKPVTIPGVGPCLTATVIVKVAYYLNKTTVVVRIPHPWGGHMR